MFNNFYCYIIFIPLMMISSMLIFLTNSWFSMWLVMELNLISFISLMIFDKTLKSEILMNYLIVQSFNSYLFLFSSLMLYFNNMIIFKFFMYLSLINKIGMPPFYLWYLKIMKNLNWMNLFFMSSIQKIIPLMILSNILIFNKISKFNLYIMIFSSFYSSIKGMTFTNLKIILTYSSIIQISWIIILSNNNEMSMINYLLIYMFINLNLSMLFKKLNISNLNELSNLKFKYFNMFMLMMLMMFSLSSMPPTFGFLMKWISIQNLILNNNFFLLLFMIMNSLISIYFYMRLMFFSMMYFYMINKNNFKFINNNNMINYKLIFMNWSLLMLLMIYELM